jgi:hypothetical protein
MTSLSVPSLHPPPAACRIPAALLMRYLLHHKGLILLDALRALSTQNKAFPRETAKPTPPTRLLKD